MNLTNPQGCTFAGRPDLCGREKQTNVGKLAIVQAGHRALGEPNEINRRLEIALEGSDLAISGTVPRHRERK